MIIYRPTDRIPVLIGDVTFWVRPLTKGQRDELYALVTRAKGEDTEDQMKTSKLAIKWCVSDVEGLVFFDGEKFPVNVGPDGFLTDETVDSIVDLEIGPDVIVTIGKLAFAGIKAHEIPGVTIDLKGVKSVKKNTLAPN